MAFFRTTACRLKGAGSSLRTSAAKAERHGKRPMANGKRLRSKRRNLGVLLTKRFVQADRLLVGGRSFLRPALLQMGSGEVEINLRVRGIFLQSVGVVGKSRFHVSPDKGQISQIVVGGRCGFGIVPGLDEIISGFHVMPEFHSQK